jgi:nitrite reductase/ring-hydroxylating ferredoxin subunit
VSAAVARPFRFCASAELAEGAVRSKLVGGRAVAVARQGGRLFAFGALCPHQQADMAHGILEAGAIACADHLWRFELESGRCTSVPGAALPVFPVREEGGAIVVEVVPR